MTPREMARIHAAAFAGQGRAWRAAELADLLGADHVYCAAEHGCFAMARLIAGEAELLTLATDPARRRQGCARRVLAALEARLQHCGAVRQVLEVAQDNAGARALYAAQGYAETARRAGYYRRPDGARVDALILAKSLG